MKQTKGLNIVGLICNLLMLGAVACCFYFAATSNSKFISVDTLKYYPVLGTIISALGAFLMIWSNIVSIGKKRDCTPRLFFTIRFLSAVMGIIALLGAIAIMFGENQPNYDVLNYETGALFFNFIVPGISILQFIFFEIQPKSRFRKTFEPFVATLIYGFAILITFIIINSGEGGAKAAHDFAPYFFFCITPETAALDNTEVWQNAVWLVGILVISYVASFVIWGINRIFHAIFVGVEINYVPETVEEESSEEEEVEEEIEEEAPKKTKASKKKVVKKTKKPVEKKVVEKPKKSGGFKSYIARSVSFGGSPTRTDHVYHISYHDRKAKTWKIQTENTNRALKVFNTQKEAIDYANILIKRHGGSIRVHSMIGRLRKA